MKRLLSAVDGHKTQIVAVLWAAFQAAIVQGWITLDPEVSRMIEALLVSLGLLTVRDAIKKVEKGGS